MKKYIVFTALFLGTTVISFGQSKNEAKSKEKKEVASKKVVAPKNAFVGDPNNPISFKETTLEQKELAYGAENLFTFEFTNTGVEPLTITNVRPSCGCTQANKPEGAVAPGETASIAVSYDTKRVGNFTKTITVTTDKTEPIVLTINGSVKPEEGGSGVTIETH